MENTRGSFEEIATHDVVVSIVAPGVVGETNKGGGSSSYGSTSHNGFRMESTINELNDSGVKFSEQNNISTPQKPPRIPNELLRRRSLLARSTCSKPKSRLIEPEFPINEALVQERTDVVYSDLPLENAPNFSSVVSDDTLEATLVNANPLSSAQGDDEEEDEDVYKSIDFQTYKRSSKKFKIFVLLECILFISLMGLMIASLTAHRMQNVMIWSLPLWRWCVFVVVIFCGRLGTEWFINILVHLAEQNFLLKKKVVYFVYGLKKSVQVFLWLSFILLAWVFLFNFGIDRSRKTKRILHYVTMAIAGCLVGAGIWLLKTLLIKILALSFHVNRFFDRIQESLFQQYVLQKLSRPPSSEMVGTVAKSRNSGELICERKVKGQTIKEEVINVEKLHKIKEDNVSGMTMKGLMKVISRTKLSTISSTLDYDESDARNEQNKDITSEWEAKDAADEIFKNVAKPDNRYIEEEDLLRFMKMDEVKKVFPLFLGATETGRIKKSALKKWVVNAYMERKSLAHSLNDTKTAVEELNRIASGVVLIVIIIVWNLMMGFLTTTILVFITSQFLLVVFMFGETAKNVFEAIIFVFVMHPFDVGDCCVIDGVQMVVEEMNILTTIFLQLDNEKIMYPNSLLAKKTIGNFYRSPEMSETIRFSISFSTTMETIATLKARIKRYIESKPQYWRPSHSVQVENIVDMNKIMMHLGIKHTINFQNGEERYNRRSELILELKKIFEELGIQYHI